MHELCSEVSGHHLLLHHWVSDKALSRARQVVDRTLSCTGPGAGGNVSDKEAESADREESQAVRQAAGEAWGLGQGGGCCGREQSLWSQSQWMERGAGGMGVGVHRGARLPCQHCQGVLFGAWAWGQHELVIVWCLAK